MEIKLIAVIWLCLALDLYDQRLIDIEVSDYIKVVLAYYRVRNVAILTHFTCFSRSDIADVSHELSAANIQSRFVHTVEVRRKWLIDAPNHTSHGFIVDKKCDHINEFFNCDGHGVIFKNNHFWLFIDNNPISEFTIIEYKSEFNRLNAMPMSDVFIATRYQNDSIKWQLFDAYKLNDAYDIEMTENGVIQAITNSDDLIVTGANFSSTRRQNLKGVNITCGLVITHPERSTSFDDPSDTNVDVFTKASINLGRNLRENLNFSCVTRRANNDGWSENGTIDGIKSLFREKKIQMTMHGVIMRPEQLSYAEFAGDIFTPRTPIIFRQPSLSAIANIFVLPLGLDVWICIFILMFIVFIIMMVQLMHPTLKAMSITAFDVVTFILGAICQQGTHLHIPTISGRLVVLTTFLAFLALFTSYSASIVALLQSPSNFITNLDDLIASPLKVGMYEADYVRYMVDAKYAAVMPVYDKKVRPQGEHGWINDSFVGVERIRNELFAFQVDSPSAYRAIGRTFAEAEKCSLTELQMIVLPTTTILVERNSAYKELITQRIKWQKEIGLMKRDELRWIPPKPYCEGGSSGFVTVGLNEIKPAVFLMLLGYGLSILILSIEILFRRTCCKRKKKPNTRFSY